jgi:hemoglobin-like flavoprotein
VCLLNCNADSAHFPQQLAIKEVQPRVLVDESWTSLNDATHVVGQLFYDKLFEIAPEVRDLFPGDMKQQRVKLMKMLGHAVGALRDPEGLVPALQGLARKHVGYGVQPEHFDPVAVALLATLETGLGDAWTSEVKASWIQAYTLVSSVMKAALIEEMAKDQQPLVSSDSDSNSECSSSDSASDSDSVPGFTATHLKLLKRQVRKVTPIEEDFNEMSKKTSTRCSTLSSSAKQGPSSLT